MNGLTWPWRLSCYPFKYVYILVRLAMNSTSHQRFLQLFYIVGHHCSSGV
jgi:hypothetical protein